MLRCLGAHATAEEVGKLNAEDLFLACACLERVPGAVEAFDARHGADIERHLRKMDVRPESIAELRQAGGRDGAGWH